MTDILFIMKRKHFLPILTFMLRPSMQTLTKDDKGSRPGGGLSRKKTKNGKGGRVWKLADIMYNV